MQRSTVRACLVSLEVYCRRTECSPGFRVLTGHLREDSRSDFRWLGVGLGEYGRVCAARFDRAPYFAAERPGYPAAVACVSFLLSYPLHAMAENSSSNTASVAIVVLVIIAAIALYFFVIRGGAEEAVPDSPDIELNIGDGDGG